MAVVAPVAADQSSRDVTGEERSRPARVGPSRKGDDDDMEDAGRPPRDDMDEDEDAGRPPRDDMDEDEGPRRDELDEIADDPGRPPADDDDMEGEKLVRIILV